MTAPEPYPAWVLEMVTDHYDRIAEGVEDKPHESIADMILEGYERGKSDADLTTAYMVGFEKGKDAARDDTAYWRLSAHVENALAPVLGYEYDEAVGWNVGEHTAESLVMAAASRIAELVEAVEVYFAAEDHLDATMDDRYEVSDTRTAAEAAIRRKDELRQALSRVRSEP